MDVAGFFLLFFSFLLFCCFFSFSFFLFFLFLSVFLDRTACPCHNWISSYFFPFFFSFFLPLFAFFLLFLLFFLLLFSFLSGFLGSIWAGPTCTCQNWIIPPGYPRGSPGGVPCWKQGGDWGCSGTAAPKPGLDGRAGTPYCPRCTGHRDQGEGHGQGEGLGCTGAEGCPGGGPGGGGGKTVAQSGE